MSPETIEVRYKIPDTPAGWMNLCASATSHVSMVRFVEPWVDQMKEARQWLEGRRAQRQAESWFDD